ncbi:hypothetical protein FPV67DRAFT_1445666 [Lyophyllum atratum]|nr:hypothetical protein FPV67DRAFT_1445666 [Lyophyllum atratum]
MPRTSTTLRLKFTFGLTRCFSVGLYLLVTRAAVVIPLWLKVVRTLDSPPIPDPAPAASFGHIRLRPHSHYLNTAVAKNCRWSPHHFQGPCFCSSSPVPHNSAPVLEGARNRGSSQLQKLVLVWAGCGGVWFSELRLLVHEQRLAGIASV